MLFSYFDWQSALLGIIVFFLVSILYRRRVRSNFPPGPPGWPFVGHLLSLGSDPPHETITKLARKYDNVMGLQLGVFPVVVLSDYESIREALVKSGDKFSDRPGMVILHYLYHGRGLVGAYHENAQKEQRRFAMSVLRGFGMGKTSFEQKINEEIDVFVDHIKKELSNVSLNPANILGVAVSNITCSIVFGRRYNYNDERFLRMLHFIEKRIQIATAVTPLNFVPFLQYFPHKEFDDAVSCTTDFNEFTREIFEDHWKDYDPDNPRDFIDVYRAEIERSKGQFCFDEDNMTRVIGDLFLAGSETTSTALLWAMMYMSKHPEVQQKVQDELDQVVGAGNHPTKAHVRQLPYTDAVLMEIQRMGAIGPMAVPHAATADTTFRGYDIKKGTIIMPNLFAVLRDANVWKEPYTFYPERFLDDNNQVIRREELIPFGIGRRSCIGEQLANTELLLFFTNIMMNFKINWSDTQPGPDKRSKIGATRIPDNFEVILKQRHQ
ncbi:cytochrome P450 2U1-like [Antedon mediterranea]|uniref:cytochrome P450 2U1-like n=1 Tax=Antedon mediterranea TaxID=105859 RepID=UPI003AF75987